MELTVQGHGFNVPEKLETHIRNKATRLNRYLPGIEDVRVELRQPGAKRDLPKTVQLTVRRKRTLLRVEESNGDPYTAFDSALDKMYARIARYKGRRTDQRQDGTPTDAELETAEALPARIRELTPEEADGEDVEAKVVRSKTFTIVPMSVEEAVEQMELLGHDFFVFMHDADAKTKVIYRRKDGDYGLLQPEK